MEDQKEATLSKTYAGIIASASLLGLLGNAIVLLVYLKHIKQLSTCRILIAHLAGCDWLFSLVQLFLTFPSFTVWHMGLSTCRFFRVSFLTGSVIAAETITLISIQRYLEVFRPDAAVKSRKSLKYGLGLVWFAGIISSLPIAAFVRIGPTSQECTEIYSDSRFHKEQQAFNIYLMLMFCVFPIMIVYITYDRIVTFLTERSQTDNLGNSDSHDEEPMSTEDARMNFKKDETCIVVSVTEDLKVAKILKFLVILFFICVLPARVMGIAISFIDVNRLARHDFHAIAFAGFIPYPFHVAVNPVIYSLLDKHFRRQAWKILRCQNETGDRNFIRNLHMETVTDEVPLSMFGHGDDTI